MRKFSIPSFSFLTGFFFYRPLDSKREPIYDAVVIYFVTPTQEAIARISRDLHSHLYSSYYFNFITPISRPLLEDLAKAAVASGCANQIAKVTSIHAIWTRSRVYVNPSVSPSLSSLSLSLAFSLSFSSLSLCFLSVFSLSLFSLSSLSLSFSSLSSLSLLPSLMLGI